MTVDDERALHARLIILEALTVMMVGGRYADKASSHPGTDAQAMVARDVRSWFDRIADTPGADPASIEREGLRMLRAIEEHVALRLGR